MNQAQDNASRQDIPLSNGKQALVVKVQPGATPEEIIKTIGTDKPEAVILILGEIAITDEIKQAQLSQLFSRGLAHAAIQHNTLVMERGVDSKTMETLIKSLSDRANRTSLARKDNNDQESEKEGNETEPPEGNPPYFVAVQNDSSDIAIETLYAVAEKINPGIPILAILVGGQDAAGEEIVGCVRRGWPILIIEDSGGFAEKLQDAQEAKEQYFKKLSEWKPSKPDEPEPAPTLIKIKDSVVAEVISNHRLLFFIKDPVVAEVLVDGNLLFFPIAETPEKLILSINLRLQENNILNQIHTQRKIYSDEGNWQEKVFRQQQAWILLLGVLITTLAAIKSAFKGLLVFPISNTQVDILNIILIGLTALLAFLIAGSNRFNPGNKWVKMRTAAEAFKREMFRYSTHAGIYSDIQVFLNKTTREATLARMLEAISRQWVEGNLDYKLFPIPDRSKKSSRKQTGGAAKNTQQQHSTANLPPYLPPDRYIVERVEHQINFYKNRSAKLARRLTLWQWAILALGATSTLLAALHLEFTITITTAAATALATYLEYTQVSNTLKQYNHAILALTNIYNWWVALGADQADQDNIDKLVDHVETTLQSEQAGWIQQMQTALTELREQQAKKGTGSSVTGPIIPEQKASSAGKASQNGQSTPSDETDTLQADGQQNTSGTDDSGSGDTGTKGITKPLDTSD